MQYCAFILMCVDSHLILCSPHVLGFISPHAAFCDVMWNDQNLVIGDYDEADKIANVPWLKI
jgi:hypothetical protein